MDGGGATAQHHQDFSSRVPRNTSLHGPWGGLLLRRAHACLLATQHCTRLTSIASIRETMLLWPEKLNAAYLSCLDRIEGQPWESLPGSARFSCALFLRRRRKERVFLLQSVAETWPDLAFFFLGVPLLRYLLILIIILISRSSYFLSVEKSYLGQKYKQSDRRGEGGPPG